MSEWIEWPGGTSPVSEETVVDVLCRDGSMVRETTTYNLDWMHIWGLDDIIAYRIIKEKE